MYANDRLRTKIVHKLDLRLFTSAVCHGIILLKSIISQLNCYLTILHSIYHYFLVKGISVGIINSASINIT